ncbi:MAG: hypothetical protein EBU96_10480, partial [Actinobacteria bacterium]|nr:hypothetical protein [Actinomycetota bacterium]
MSNKTVKKRIALAAVSSIVAGLLSSLSAPAANALVSTGYIPKILMIATTADGDGTVATNIGPTADQNFSQIGWLADTRTSSLTTTGGVYTASAGATGQAIVGAKLAFFATGEDVTTTDGLSVVVTGGTLSGMVGTGGGASLAYAATAGTYSQLNSTATVYTQDTTPTGTMPLNARNSRVANAIAGIFNISAAAGSTATIAIYSGANITSLDTATNGTLVASWSISIVASSGVGVYAASKSDIYQQACMVNDTVGTSGTNAYDTTSACANGRVGVIWVDLDDSNGQNVTSGTVTASSSAGNITASGTTTTGSIIAAATTGFASVVDDADGRMWFYVAQPTSNAAGETVVTITLNGAVIATKTIKWTGDIATLTINSTSCTSFSVDQATDTSEANIGDACVIYTAKDAAGNSVTLTSHPVINAATGALVGSTLSATTEQTAYAAYQSSSVGYGYTTLLVPANSLSGASTYSIKLTNAAGATITSNTASVTVSRGATNSFEASWDKASYATGDVATLTITLKDAYGNLMATGTPLTGLSLDTNTAGLALFAGTPCVATSTVTNGVRTCKYSVLNTAGSYAYSVDVTT